MVNLFRSSTRAVAVVAFTAALLIVVHLTNFAPLSKFKVPLRLPSLSQADGIHEFDTPSCRNLPGGDDVVIVMRTGATEIKDKLPIHFNTTFRCYPNTLIFSDYEEVLFGHQVHDVLASVDENIKETNGDFEHYKRLQRLGREGLDKSELSDSSYESGPMGKNDNAGWRLDKWKFLPMMVRTLELQPDKKWYLFLEADTYLVWSNLLQWLPLLNPSMDLYYGSEVQIGEDIFGHGGSGLLLSRSAVQKAADLYTNNPDEWHMRTSMHWAGDCILGTALSRAGIGLTWTWPMFQGGNPADMNWADAKVDRIKLLWCGPAFTYHHFDPDQFQDVWNFEQRWLHESTASPGNQFWRRGETILYHSDTFYRYVMPNISSERTDWTNLSPEVIPDTQGLTLDECRRICEEKNLAANASTCLQYARSESGCSVGSEVKMGKPAKDVQSGWIIQAVDSWINGLEECGDRHGWSVI